MKCDLLTAAEPVWVCGCACVGVFAQTTILIDWLIGTSCYSAEVGQDYSKKKVEAVQDKQKVMT